MTLNWIEQRLSESGLTIEQLVQTETQKQASGQVSISNSIGSLRLLGAVDWCSSVETMSSVEQVLQSDPAAVYGGMDFPTRDRYRHAVEKVAKQSCTSELGIVHKAIHFAVAQSVVESVRGIHLDYVFAYRGHRIETLNNSASQRVRSDTGIADLHMHDLRHTVGMRLREAELREETIADILWHMRPSMTAHYSVVQIDELVEALNRITDERIRTNRNLAMIAREARGAKSPPKVPTQMKSGYTISHLTA